MAHHPPGRRLCVCCAVRPVRWAVVCRLRPHCTVCRAALLLCAERMVAGCTGCGPTSLSAGLPCYCVRSGRWPGVRAAPLHCLLGCPVTVCGADGGRVYGLRPHFTVCWAALLLCAERTVAGCKGVPHCTVCWAALLLCAERTVAGCAGCGPTSLSAGLPCYCVRSGRWPGVRAAPLHCLLGCPVTVCGADGGQVCGLRPHFTVCWGCPVTVCGADGGRVCGLPHCTVCWAALLLCAERTVAGCTGGPTALPAGLPCYSVRSGRWPCVRAAPLHCLLGCPVTLCGADGGRVYGRPHCTVCWAALLLCAERAAAVCTGCPTLRSGRWPGVRAAPLHCLLGCPVTVCGADGGRVYWRPHCTVCWAALLLCAERTVARCTGCPTSLPAGLPCYCVRSGRRPCVRAAPLHCLLGCPVTVCGADGGRVYGLPHFTACWAALLLCAERTVAVCTGGPTALSAGLPCYCVRSGRWPGVRAAAPLHCLLGCPVTVCGAGGGRVYGRPYCTVCWAALLLCAERAVAGCTGCPTALSAGLPCYCVRSGRWPGVRAAPLHCLLGCPVTVCGADGGRVYGRPHCTVCWAALLLCAERTVAGCTGCGPTALSAGLPCYCVRSGRWPGVRAALLHCLLGCPVTVCGADGGRVYGLPHCTVCWAALLLCAERAVAGCTGCGPTSLPACYSVRSGRRPGVRAAPLHCLLGCPVTVCGAGGGRVYGLRPHFTACLLLCAERAVAGCTGCPTALSAGLPCYCVRSGRWPGVRAAAPLHCLPVTVCGAGGGRVYGLPHCTVCWAALLLCAERTVAGCTAPTDRVLPDRQASRSCRPTAPCCCTCLPTAASPRPNTATTPATTSAAWSPTARRSWTHRDAGR